MKFISICSGIEAASVAFGPLGWKAVAFSEIEPFPCAVLAHHYPDVPNMGDMSKFREWPDELFAEADAIVGGPPCQAFSVAGLRNGLNDDRGNLTLTYAEMINHADAIRSLHGKPPVIVLYENVPGLLSDKTGAYGCFLAALAGEAVALEPPGSRWTDAGCVFGPKRAIAWRVLDAQYFALAQRRRRVFVVASARDGFDPATVLFEWDGVRRDSAPSREAREGYAGRAARSVALRGREGGGTAELGDELQNCLRASSGGGDKPHVLAPLAFGGNNTAGPIEVATARNACASASASASGRMDFETETFLVQPAHTLRGEGFDASEDGTGRGTPLVPVAFSCKDYGADAGEVAPTLRSMGHDKSRANAGGQVAIAFNARQDPDHWHDRTGPLDTDGSTQAVAFAENSRAELRLEGGDGSRCGALSTGGGKPGQGAPMIATMQTVGTMSASGATERKHGFGWGQQDWESGYCQPDAHMKVRRLTPTECARLQGFPDDYLDITYRNKPAADGPKYKALGNSWAVPCVTWIGQRIAASIE